MKITILCSDPLHPINKFIEHWIAGNRDGHEIFLIRKKEKITDGDILFLVSCNEIVTKEERERFRKSLVIHASDLPRGRGWSPHIWELIQGAGAITMSMIEAEDQVDSGKIWHQSKVNIPEHAVWHEINDLIFKEEIKMIDYAVQNFDSIAPRDQSEVERPTYYRKRIPEDSELDPKTSLQSQFNLLRVCDPNRFPAFFELHGERYKLTLEKYDAPKN